MMRSAMIGLLVHGASAMCLLNGTAPEARKNLVNPIGEGYPLGIYICNWQAADAASKLAGTIIEEVLGFNVSYFSGGGTLAGMQAVTGCTNPGATDPGCGAEVTYHHVNTEAWVGSYPVDFVELQKNYPSMAPDNLASLGYQGLTSMYISSDQRRDAYAASGLPLEYYESWDATWKRPWEYFDTLPSINKSLMMPCASGFPSSQLEVYLEQSGDTQGVQVNASTGLHSAVCVDDAFWIAPACRANHSQCVLMLTGGGGWGIMEMMQKATAHHMPLAVGVAATWAVYTELPLVKRMVLYWWTPDPTFLDLDPLSLVFPKNDRLAFRRGDYSTQAAGIDIRTIVSSDLGRLAPKVKLFLSNMRLDLATMNAILLQNKNLQEDMSDTVCRWIQANEAEWKAWIPDDTKCFPGFGLFDDTLGDYVLDRDTPAGKRCLACPSGKFSAPLIDNLGSTYICEACPLGTSQPSGGQQQCLPCGQGEYQDESGQYACKRCPVGFYEEAEGARECTKCPSGSRTLGQGASFAADCGCEEGRINVAEAGALECVECQAGLICPLMGTRQSLMTGNHSLGPDHVAAVKEGFYVTETDPLQAFKCGAIWQCPGGRPKSCAGGRDGVPCAECPEGKTWTAGKCNECEAWRTGLWAVSVAFVFVFLTCAYYLMTSTVTAKASVLFTTTCAFGMLVSLLQSIGIIGMMTVDWPVDLSGFFAYFKVLLLDLDSFGFACFAGVKTDLRYFTSVLFFPAAIGWLAASHAVSQLVPRHRWDWTKTASCMGQVLQVSFSTMSTIALAPLMCYSHPNSQQSLLKYPNIICGSGEHGGMLAFGAILLVLGVFGFLAVCAFAAIRVPHWSASEQHSLVRCFRFLVFRFRLDSWWPWKVPMLNALDCWMSFCILILVAGTKLYVEPVSKDASVGFISTFSMMIMVIIFSSTGLMILMSLVALVNKAAMGGHGEYAIFNLKRTVNVENLAEKLHDMAELLGQMDEEELRIALEALSIFDTRRITDFMSMASAEMLPDNSGRFNYSTRVSSASLRTDAKKS